MRVRIDFEELKIVVSREVPTSVVFVPQRDSSWQKNSLRGTFFLDLEHEGNES